MLGCQRECQSRRYPDAPSRPPRTVGGLLAELGLIGPIRTTPITGILRRAHARGVEEEMQQLSSSMSREPLTTLAIGVVAVALGSSCGTITQGDTPCFFSAHGSSLGR